MVDAKVISSNTSGLRANRSPMPAWLIINSGPALEAYIAGNLLIKNG